MMQDDRIVFFPYRSKSYPLIRTLKKKGKKFLLASYTGSGLVGKDYAFAVNRENEGLIVEDINNVDFNFVTKLVVLDSGTDEEDYIGIDYILREASALNCEIKILSRYLLNKYSINESYDTKINQVLCEINKPVIFVCGLLDTLFNSMVVVNLYDELLKKDISSSVFTGDNDLSYLNFTVYDLDILNRETVTCLYYYLYRDIVRLCNLDKTDIIIVQVPKGIIQISNQIYNDFGIYFTILNEICSPDFIICNLPYDHARKEVIDKINNVFDYKYRKKIDCFCLNNYYAKLNSPILLSNEESIVFLPEESKKELVKDIKGENDYKKIVDLIIKKLRG